MPEPSNTRLSINKSAYKMHKYRLLEEPYPELLLIVGSHLDFKMICNCTSNYETTYFLNQTSSTTFIMITISTLSLTGLIVDQPVLIYHRYHQPSTNHRIIQRTARSFGLDHQARRSRFPARSCGVSGRATTGWSVSNTGAGH